MLRPVRFALLTLALLTAGGADFARGRQSPARPQPIPLWPTEVPLATGDTDADKPTISVYLPEKDRANGSAVVICPGGGYTMLCDTYEGHDIARWLNRYGIAGIVLKYRVRYRHPAPLLDAQRALRTVRANAKAWNLDPAKIGLMGFSAGGHLAATAATHFDTGHPQAADPIERQGSRPDFLVLVYPVITMGPKTHGGSRDILLGTANRSPAEEESLSNEKQVSDRTPPTFLVHARTDTVVPVENSAMFYAALQAHHVPAEFWELPTGEHGLGVGNGPLWTQWQAACMNWLMRRGLASPSAP